MVLGIINRQNPLEMLLILKLENKNSLMAYLNIQMG